MKSVSRFESNLLKILYAAMGNISMASALPLISRAFRGKPPSCLSRDSVDLIEQAIRKGCISKLVHWGGWQTESFLRNEQIKKGRVWERSQPADLGLTFSAVTMDLLIWLTNANPTAARVKWRTAKNVKVTVGDHFFLFRLFSSIRHTEPGRRLVDHPVFARNGLIRLTFPRMFAGKKVAEPDFQPWVSGVGAAIIEAMQNQLTEHWLGVEKEKPKIAGLKAMQDLGQAQTSAITGFIETANAAKRTDLYRFVLQLLNQLMNDNSRARDWTELLSFQGVRMADRESSYQAALAVLNSSRLLDQQNQYFATVTYIDEDYQASQLWKSNWERYEGDRLLAQCQRVLQETTF